MALQLIIKLILIILQFLLTAKATEFYPPCCSFSGKSNFSSNSVYCLNDAYLNSPLNIDNIQNVTFQGNATEIILNPEAFITVVNSSNITFHSMIITKYGSEETTAANTAFEVENSTQCIFSDMIFKGNQSARAIRMVENSVAEITNCKFYKGHAQNGGAIYSVSSTLIFNGQSLFESNTADFAGGCVYSIGTILIFQDNVTFSCNRAGVSCGDNLDSR